MIRVDMLGFNPIPICLLLSENIEIVSEESYHILKYMTLLPMVHNGTVGDDPQFIKLNALHTL
jgi:hypothetical protein